MNGRILTAEEIASAMPRAEDHPSMLEFLQRRMIWKAVIAGEDPAKVFETIMAVAS